MGHINCSRTKDDQNLFAFQSNGEIYYHLYKDVLPGTELLVWYGDKYAKELGITTAYEGISIDNDPGSYSSFDQCYIFL